MSLSTALNVMGSASAADAAQTAVVSNNIVQRQHARLLQRKLKSPR